MDSIPGEQIPHFPEMVRRLEEQANTIILLQAENRALQEKNSENAQLSAVMITANTELAFQNKEKEKRAAELIKAIGDLKISQDKILEVNNELEAFSYSVSHDLRAPLRAVNGYAIMLQNKYGHALDSEAHRLMNNIVNYAKKMGLLIDELLAFSRIGRRELVKGQLSMDRIVAEVWEECHTDRAGRDIELKLHSLCPALADNIAIKQVWTNLLLNAIKYTRRKPNARIEISSVNSGEEVIYSIQDNGAGFDMRFVNKLFGVFQRLHSDEEFEGIGVGLALVQRIVLKHGGRVWAEAIVDEGATFYFTLEKPMNV